MGARSFLGLCVAAGLSVLVSGCSLQSAAPVSSVGTNVAHIEAPSFSAPLLHGGTASFPGKDAHRVVVLDFWGSWCGPCTAAQPQINALARSFVPRGVVFLGVDERDDPYQGRAFEIAQDVPYPSVNDASGAIAAAYGVDAPPYIVVIGADGRIMGRYLGTVAGVDAELETLLQRH